MSLQDKFLESLEKENAKFRNDLQKAECSLRLKDMEIESLKKIQYEDVITITRQNAWLDAAHELIKSLEDQVSELRAEKMVKEIITN